jgi:hypothetical protein
MRQSCIIAIMLMPLWGITSCGKFEAKSVAGFSGPVQKIVLDNCASCHAGGNAEGGFGVVDKPSEMINGGYIIPGNAADSLIYKKISTTPPYGARMPFGGPYLKPSQLEDVSTWINSMGSFTVTIKGNNLTTDPSQPQKVAEGETLIIETTPIEGFTISETIGGTCATGSWNGNTYTTGKIVADCEVELSAFGTFTVTATGSNLTIAPAEAQSIASGATASLTVTAQGGYTLSKDVGGDCPTGSWSGSVYTTGSIVANCTVSFAVEGQVTVTATGSHATFTPSAPQTILKGNTQAYVVTAASGYTTSSTVGGTCPAGTWSGTTYTTGPINSTCTVTFSATTQNPCPTVNPAISFASDVLPVMNTAGCTGCHNPDENDKAYFSTTNGGAPDYASITAGTNKQYATFIVKTGDPLSSWLYTKTTTSKPSGDRMPMGGPYLSESDQSKICNWIYYGANNN